MSDDQQEGMRTVDGEESVRMNQSPGYKRCLATQHPAACALRQVTVPVSEAGNVENNDCQTASGSTRASNEPSRSLEFHNQVLNWVPKTNIIRDRQLLDTIDYGNQPTVC